MKLNLKPLFFVTVLLCLNACSTLNINDTVTNHQSDDPIEEFNRAIFAFNDKADKLILRPIAKTYDNTLPALVKKGVGNFFTNLGEPLNALNNLFQGKLDRTLVSTYRFTVNSTVGVLGFVDVAAKYNVAPAREDFGQTLAAWGVPPGPYIMLPFFGPTNLRHGIGRIVENNMLDPISELTSSRGERYGLFGLSLVDQRADLLGSDELLDSQLDPYGFLKQAYEQNRINQLYDGNPPEVEQEDFDF